MKVNETFFSVQGEGVYTGLPTVFIRLQGCNLRCTWCDTVYAQDPLAPCKEMTVEDVRGEVMRLGPTSEWVCITGGEPLYQALEIGELVKALHERGRKVEIETNGSIVAPDWGSLVDSWCVDIKCPSSGGAGKSREFWFESRKQDQIKFVVADETDLRFVEEVLDRNPDPSPTVLISPAFTLLKINPLGKEDYFTSGVWMQRCAEFVKEHNLRFSLQIHKFVWPPSQRGV